MDGWTEGEGGRGGKKECWREGGSEAGGGIVIPKYLRDLTQYITTDSHINTAPIIHLMNKIHTYEHAYTLNTCTGT